MAVKLDILFNYIFDNSKLKKQITDLNKTMVSAWSPYTRQNILNMGQRGNLNEYFKRFNISARQFNDILKNNMDRIRALNTKGFFSDYLKSLYGGELPKYKMFGGKSTNTVLKDRKNLNEQEIQGLAYQKTFEQIQAMDKEKRDEIKAESVAWKENEKFDQKIRIQEKRNQEAQARKIMGEEKWNKKMNILHSKALEENKKRDDLLRKKQLMLMLGKWGKFGVYGIFAQQAIKYLSKAFGLMSSTAQQGLSWQRTISGGASGGSWFGQDLAAYQRAGIDANKVQNFKRGLQGYIGSVKLGMGNAAPLMYLGLSALGDPDQLEQEMEKSLRRLPKDVSYALASQMGLDYDMWEAIYTGKIDKAREKPGYDKDAIEKWSEVANKLNDLLTSIKTYGFNRFANLAYNVTHPGAALGQMTLAQGLSMIPGLLNPATLVPTLFKFADINVVIRNDKGDVVGTGTTQIEDTMKEIPQSIGE